MSFNDQNLPFYEDFWFWVVAHLIFFKLPLLELCIVDSPSTYVWKGLSICILFVICCLRIRNLIDIDECTTLNHDCSPNGECTNVDGTFLCNCKTGFRGDGKTCACKL